MWEPVGRDNLATHYPSASAERRATMKLVGVGSCLSRFAAAARMGAGLKTMRQLYSLGVIYRRVSRGRAGDLDCALSRGSSDREIRFARVWRGQAAQGRES